MIATILDIKRSLGNKPYPYKGKSVEKLGAGQNSLISEYLTSDTHKPLSQPYSIKDYHELKEKAIQGIDPPLAQELELSSEDKDILTVGLPVFNQVLMDLVPQNTATTLFGVDERDPSDFEKHKFIRAMRIVEDPGHVLDLLQAGQLSGLEIEVLSLVYPEYYATLSESTLDAVAGHKSVAENELSLRQNSGLSTLLQIPRLTPAILQEARKDPESAELDLPQAEGTEISRIAGK